MVVCWDHKSCWEKGFKAQVKQLASYHYLDVGSSAGFLPRAEHGQSDWISRESIVEVWCWLWLPKTAVTRVVWQQLWSSSSTSMSDATCSDEEQHSPGMQEAQKPLGFSGFWSILHCTGHLWCCILNLLCWPGFLFSWQLLNSAFVLTKNENKFWILNVNFHKQRS